MRSEGFRWRPRQLWGLVKTAAVDWKDDRALSHAAALAYYALFALGPLVLIVVGAAGLALEQDSVREALVRDASRLVGSEVAEGLATLLSGASTERSMASIWVGVATLVISAGAVFRHLRQSMNAIWEVKEDKPLGWKERLWVFVRKNVFGTAGVFGLAFLLTVSLVFSAIINSSAEWFAAQIPLGQAAWRAVQFVITVLVFGVAFAAMFRYIPEVEIRWRDVVIGATVTSVLFVVGQALIGLYMANTATAGSFGAASVVIVVLVWIYYSSLIFFFGAELTQVYANRYGAGIVPGEDAHAIGTAPRRHRKATRSEP